MDICLIVGSLFSDTSDGWKVENQTRRQYILEVLISCERLHVNKQSLGKIPEEPRSVKDLWTAGD